MGAGWIQDLGMHWLKNWFVLSLLIWLYIRHTFLEYVQYNLVSQCWVVKVWFTKSSLPNSLSKESNTRDISDFIDAKVCDRNSVHNVGRPGWISHNYARINMFSNVGVISSPTTMVIDGYWVITWNLYRHLSGSCVLVEIQEVGSTGLFL